MTPDDVRAHARRDWDAIAAAKVVSWIAPPMRSPAAELLADLAGRALSQSDLAPAFEQALATSHRRHPRV